jgi:integrase
MIWTPTKDSRIKKRDGVYWARFMKKGRRVEQSLDTKSFELAKHQVEDIEAKLLAGRSWKKERQLFKEAWLEFLIDKKTGNKVRPGRQKTLKEYAAFGVRYFLPFFGDMRLSDIDGHAWDEFIEHVRKEHGDILFFNIRKYMSGFLTWAKRHEKILTPPYLRDPDAVANKEKEHFTPGKAYSKAELKRLLKASRKHGAFHLWMLMAVHMGMRPGEINQLLLERIDLEAGVIDLRRADTKTNTARRVPIHKAVLSELALRVVYATSKGSPYLFPNRNDRARPMDPQGFKKVWYAIAASAEVEGRMYDFRHTFITHAIAGGLNPAAVGKMTGTSLKMIEQYYLHLSNDDLRREMARFQI